MLAEERPQQVPGTRGQGEVLPDAVRQAVERGLPFPERLPKAAAKLLGGALDARTDVVDLPLVGRARIEDRQGEGGDHHHEEHPAEHVLLEGGREDGVVRGDASGDAREAHQAFRNEGVEQCR